MNKAEGQTISQRDAQVRVEPGAPSAEDLKGKFGRDIFRDFDYDDRRFNDKFVETLMTQQAHCPVARSMVGKGFWWVTRNEDVRRIGQDWKTFSNAAGYQPNRPEGLPYLYPEESDPPRADRARLRCRQRSAACRQVDGKGA